MNILLLGATGRTGKLLLKEAIKRGHFVHALVRDKGRIQLSSNSIKVFEGTPTDRDVLMEAMKDCGAVISCLNISRRSDFPWARLRTPKDFLAETIQNVIDLAPSVKLDRVIVISASGVGDSRAEIPGWFAWFIAHSNLGPAYDGHEQQEKLLKASSLKWTAVRPTGLINSEKKKDIIVSFKGQPKPKLTISRLNVARFIMEILEEEKYIGKTPTISEK